MTNADRLASAIESAAVKAGIIKGDQPLTGPQLLLLCDDLASAATSMRSACIEKVKEIALTYEKSSRPVDKSFRCGVAAILRTVAQELESLSIEPGNTL